MEASVRAPSPVIPLQLERAWHAWPISGRRNSVAVGSKIITLYFGG